ncbi:YbjN domain-containing protein [Neomegalonema sp.]|uniref:YbjN domain-containing protein n=1 Tax=Neomegalonema sp. TaxID=2039713 RepID=UPI00261C7233|nr:YbjN domain-containing protein [Neomegalonema sp.]MDD2868451.1 YbjN domain-containing protein [Neomegalonema sp.]
MKSALRLSRAARRAISAAVLLLGAAAAPSRAEAPPAGLSLLDGSDVGSILEIARQFGSAERSQDYAGNPMLRGRAGGLFYLVVFQDCYRGPCGSMQMRSSWLGDRESVPSPEALATWNLLSRFCKASLFGSSTMLMMDVSLTGGVSRRNVESNFDLWTSCLKSFETQVIVSGAGTWRI